MGDSINFNLNTTVMHTRILKHLISTLSVLWVISNLLLGVALLIPIAIVSALLPLQTISRVCYFLIDLIYRSAVCIDSFWMERVIGIQINIVGDANIDDSPIVICNHQSWFDIALVQEVITGHGPIVKFLVKRELIWVPIIGWVCLALNFPRLRRSGDVKSRKKDFSIIEKATQNQTQARGALLIFPEGTRFSMTKKVAQAAPYQRLLKPKSGGLRVITQHVCADKNLIDVTIDYHQEKPNLWDCLHGEPRQITIHLAHYKLSDIDDIETWLNQRWLEKDRLFTSAANNIKLGD